MSTQFTAGRFQGLDSAGKPLSGGRLYTFASGTTTFKAAYTDSTLGTACTYLTDGSSLKYISLDARGECQAWLGSGTYTMRLTDATGAQIWSVDGVAAADSSVLATLASTASASTGAGLVAYSASQSYALGTVGDKLRQIVSVKDYGAKGDGTTDDTGAINSALAASSFVYIPPGTYIVSQINAQSNQTIYGAGPASILKQKAGQAQFTYVINAGAKTGVTIRDLQIDGNGNAQSTGEHNHGIYLADATDCKVINVTVHDCNGDAIYIASTTNSILCQRITVQNCYVYNLGRLGICVCEYGARNIKIKDNDGRVGTYVTTSTSHGNPIHLEIDTQPSVWVGAVTIQGNELTDAGISVGGNFSELSITGNTIRATNNTTAPGLIALVNAFDTSIIGNTLIGDGTTALDGISFQDAGVSGAASVKNVVISGNTLSTIGGHGINFLATAPGVPSLGKLVISGNVINTVGGSGGKNGIVVQQPYPDVQIYGNTIDGTTSQAMTLAGCQNFKVYGNRIKEFAGTYGIYMATNSAIGAGPGEVFGNTISHSTPAGKVGVRVENEATNTRIKIKDNDLAGVAIGTSIGASAVKCFSADNITGNDALTGTFTMPAAASLVITNANTQSGSQITLIPTNASAAALMGSAKFLYATATTPGTSFTVQTANATAAAGTETFSYRIST